VKDEDYRVPFEIIGYAGDSKSHSKLAIDAAREGNFDEIKEHLKLAEQGMLEAHECQTGLLTEEANGNPIPVNIITVHAQDHLTMALMMDELADVFVDLYQRIEVLEKKLAEKE